MEDSLSITDQEGFTVKFSLYWYKQHSDLTIQENDSEGVLSKMMLKAPPEVLRTIADQFYAWADTVENEMDATASPSRPLPKGRED